MRPGGADDFVDALQGDGRVVVYQHQVEVDHVVVDLPWLVASSRAGCRITGPYPLRHDRPGGCSLNAELARHRDVVFPIPVRPDDTLAVASTHSTVLSRHLGTE